MNRVFILGARRTGISPRNGALKRIPFYDLAARVVDRLSSDLSGLATTPPSFTALIAGNALGAGGNPARLMALASNLPWTIPAMTIDTQCCSGLDAIGVAFQQLRSRPHGSVHAVATAEKGLVLAGGAESASLAPIRQDRQSGVTYEEAPFTPWLDCSPDMVQAALNLEAQRHVTVLDMVNWAIKSHRLGLHQSVPSRLGSDTLPRVLTPELCHRAAGFKAYNPTLMAPLADGAAFVAMASSVLQPAELEGGASLLEILDYCQIGSDPGCPGLSTAALDPWLRKLETKFGFNRQNLVVSLMESFAAQVLVNIQDLGLNGELINPWGGLLAKGHPIGASGAVLVCDLFDYLQHGHFGLAAIPASGGLASGLLVRRVT